MHVGKEFLYALDSQKSISSGVQIEKWISNKLLKERGEIQDTVITFVRPTIS